jgi:hypothetical protein
VVTVGLTIVDEFVAPVISFDVSPDVPTYHWYVNGPVPVGETDKVLDCPDEIEDGVAVGAGAEGGTQGVTVTVAGLLS